VPTIAKLEIVPLIYRLPKGRPYGMARGLTSIRQASLVKLTTDDGVEGIGDAWGPPAVTKAYLELIESYFVGREVYGFEHAASAILSTHYHFGIQNQMMSCLSGIDIACLDAIGKMLSLPVVKLIGGPARDRLPIYASGGYFTEEPEKDFPEQPERLRVSGVKRAKIKIGAGPQCDRERVSIARKVLGDNAGIIVDANGNYTYDEALESMRRIADYGIEWYEEPLPPLNFDGYAALSDCLICAPSTSYSPTYQCVEAFGPDARSPCWLAFITCVYRHTCGEPESDWRRPVISSHRSPIIRTAGTSCSRR
jgi:D-galactarolactone cycloisomerase